MAKKWGPWINLGDQFEGGQAVVFKVRHKETHELGALKRLKNPNRKNRFRKEIKAAQELYDAHIVRLVDTDLDDDRPYAVFEYIPGGSIAELTRDELKQISLDVRLSWCQQICEALGKAHAAGCVHRDIKPENILLSQDRLTAKLCDFGLVYIDPI